MTEDGDPRTKLQALKPEHGFFVGIDSDGCVFDTMELKQRECFCPAFIRFFGLQGISRYARETWEFVNLYSKMRGCNRFLALIETIRLLGLRPEVKKRGQESVDLGSLEAWTRKETRLGTQILAQYALKVKDPVIDLVLNWSKAVNLAIEEMAIHIPPFPLAAESLEALNRQADVMVISQTPVADITREWKQASLDRYLTFVAGQEHGTKIEHLEYAAIGKYDADKILMIGDAPGDLSAARDAGVMFYPIIPGGEDESWERFFHEALMRFFSSQYKGEYETSLILEFEESLPANPWWEN
ncbi:MAG: HAD family hydrolase [Spirochaetaceae bacterium]|nr:MAG: HAD family hydrolase [Spirochaetaceae bacterium]